MLSFTSSSQRCFLNTRSSTSSSSPQVYPRCLVHLQTKKIDVLEASENPLTTANGNNARQGYERVSLTRRQVSEDPNLGAPLQAASYLKKPKFAPGRAVLPRHWMSDIF